MKNQILYVILTVYMLAFVDCAFKDFLDHEKDAVQGVIRYADHEVHELKGIPSETTKALQKVVANINNSDAVTTEVKGCQCSKETHGCGCCGGIHLLDLDLEFCVYVAYLPKDYGVSLVVTMDGKTVINVTVSARNPPPICFAIPKLKKLLSLCLDLYNLDISKDAFSGCVKLEFKLAYVLHTDLDLGCFNVPLAAADVAGIANVDAWLKEQKIQLAEIEAGRRNKIKEMKLI